MASSLFSVPMGNVTVPQLSRIQRGVEWVESMEQEQLLDERRAAKMAHKRVCMEIAERVEHGFSASEFRDLTERLQRMFSRVVKRHERYLHHADLEEEDLIEEADWLRLVQEDHDKALDSITFRFEKLDEKVHRFEIPVTPIPSVAQVMVNASTTIEPRTVETDTSRVEQVSGRPTSTLSCPSSQRFRSDVTPSHSSRHSSFPSSSDSFQRLAKQVSTLTSRVISFFAPKQVSPSSSALEPVNMHSQQPTASSATVRRSPRSPARPAHVTSSQPVCPTQVDAGVPDSPQRIGPSQSPTLVNLHHRVSQEMEISGSSCIEVALRHAATRTPAIASV